MPALAEDTDRDLFLTSQDGSPVGALFDEWLMVPGDRATTALNAHRTGGGESSIVITLGDEQVNGDTAPVPVEEDVVITVATNGIELSASAADLRHKDVILDFGRSAEAVLPIDVTFELEPTSSNSSQQQSIDLSLVVVAADTQIPAAPVQLEKPASAPAAGVTSSAERSRVPVLASTGSPVRDLLVVVGLATCLGLLLIGKRKRHDEVM